MTALPKTRIFVLGAGLMAVALSAREGHARPLDLRCGDLPPDYCAALTEAILARWPDLGTRDEGAKASLAIELVPTALTANRAEPPATAPVDAGCWRMTGAGHTDGNTRHVKRWISPT